MCYSDGESCRISKTANGYTVSLRDPEIVKANKKPSSHSKSSMVSSSPWKDPNVSFVFTSMDKLMEFLKEALPKALPIDEYGSTFSKALKETDSDD